MASDLVFQRPLPAWVPWHTVQVFSYCRTGETHRWQIYLWCNNSIHTAPSQSTALATVPSGSAASCYSSLSFWHGIQKGAAVIGCSFSIATVPFAFPQEFRMVFESVALFLYGSLRLPSCLPKPHPALPSSWRQQVGLLC